MAGAPGVFRQPGIVSDPTTTPAQLISSQGVPRPAFLSCWDSCALTAVHCRVAVPRLPRRDPGPGPGEPGIPHSGKAGTVPRNLSSCVKCDRSLFACEGLCDGSIYRFSSVPDARRPADGCRGIAASRISDPRAPAEKCIFDTMPDGGLFVAKRGLRKRKRTKECLAVFLALGALGWG